MPVYQYALYPGYNMPVGSLQNVETLSYYGGPTLYPPSSWGSYDPGQLALNLNGLAIQRGYPSCEWSWHGNPGGVLYYGQARGLRAWICGTLWSGTATVYTKTTNETTYERCNAVLTFPKFNDAMPNFKAFTRYSIHLGRLITL